MLPCDPSKYPVNIVLEELGLFLILMPNVKDVKFVRHTKLHTYAVEVSFTSVLWQSNVSLRRSVSWIRVEFSEQHHEHC